MNEPNAQGQQPGAEIPAPENQTQQDPQASQGGVQGRIDELTREKYEERRAREEAERRAQEAEVQRQQLVLLLSQQAAAQAQQTRPAQEELDPEQQRLIAAMEARLAPELQSLRQQNAQLAKQLGLTTIMTQVEHPDPRVKQRIQVIANNAAAKGLLGQMTVKDMELMALGSLYEEEQAKSRNKGQPPAGLLTNATPAPRVQQNSTPQGHPADLDRRSLKEQDEYWTKYMAGKTF